MSEQDFKNPVDPPEGWQRRHLDRYVATDGAEGQFWQGVPTLLLTTIGRRTGQARRTPLIYGRDGDDYLIVASYGGRDNAPEWYLNLVAEERVHIQVGAEQLDGTARDATPVERARLWPVMAEIFPSYNDYQKKTEREIPVVIITPVTDI
jgi:deazaflavin-dependent oxidoreductase (nitroreductase family)